MKGSKAFNNILDECLERLLSGETIEQCLQSYPEQAAELKPLLQTALAVKKASTIQPRTEFIARAGYQFRSALQEAVSRRSRPLFGWLPRWATVVTIVLVVLLAGSGTVAAASNSMPDNPLYSVKLATEQVQLILTPSDISKAKLCAKLADERVAEIIYIASKGKPEQVKLTTQRLNACLTKVVILSTVPSEEAGALLAPVPAPAPSERAAGNKDFRVQTSDRARLRRTVVRYAINHPAALHAALDKSPESVKPALRRAIAVSEAGYKKALEALD